MFLTLFSHSQAYLSVSSRGHSALQPSCPFALDVSAHTAVTSPGRLPAILYGNLSPFTLSKVVISSSWRGNPGHKPRIYFILREILEKNGIDVIGDTPFIETEFDEIVRDVVDLDGISEEYNIKSRY